MVPATLAITSAIPALAIAAATTGKEEIFGRDICETVDEDEDVDDDVVAAADDEDDEDDDASRINAAPTSILVHSPFTV